MYSKLCSRRPTDKTAPVSSCTCTEHPAPGTRAVSPRRPSVRLRAAARQRAESFVVDVLLDRRILSAHRAIRIAPKLQGPERHVERIIGEKTADQRLALLKNQFDRFGRLDDSDDTREHAQDPGFLAR